MHKVLVSRKDSLWAPLALLAGLLSLGSATVHLAVTPQHFQEWWGYGVFFLGMASLQTLYGLGLLAPRARFAASPWYLMVGILGGFLVMVVYAVSRLLGIPFFGPHAGHVEGIGTIDVLSKVVELGLVATLAAMLFRSTGLEKQFWARARLAVLGTLVLTVTLGLGGVFIAEQQEPFAIFQQSGIPTPAEATTQTLPTYDELFPLLVRRGYGPRGTSADVIYAPTIFFQVLDEEVPSASLVQPTLIFRVAEGDHDHYLRLTPEPPPALVRLDGGDAIQAYQVNVLLDGTEHRTSDYLFPMPEGMSQETLSQGEHTLTFAMPLESGEENTFTWQLPLGLPGEVQPANLPYGAVQPQVSSLRPILTRTQKEVEYGGREGIRVEATYATPEYFAAAFPPDAASRYLPNQFIFFQLTESAHASTLPDSRPDIVLSLQGQRFSSDQAEAVTTSAHHRVTLVRFPVKPPQGSGHRVMELRLPAGEGLVWHLPLRYTGAVGAGGFSLTPGFVLAILGGLIAAMWPCLFQLTVFFIPALGGLSMRDASGTVLLQRRMSVVKAALFFVLGFTLVYTAAGALIGFAAGRLADTPNFQVWQRYLGIGGGVLIILLALRVAAKVRAPLVCKMPVLSKMAHNPRPANPLEMMLAGLAFATGCMTCFGAALVVAMVVYVGLSGSAALGALTLFLFSLGMGIPLVIAASAMAKVLPLLFRMEKVIPWMGLAASLLMVGFAILLITGNYMFLTEWVYRTMPGL